MIGAPLGPLFKGDTMPAAPRIQKSKATKIAYKILGKPPVFQERTPNEIKIQKHIMAQETARKNY